MATDILESSLERYPKGISAPTEADPRTAASVTEPMQEVVNGVRWVRARVEQVHGEYAPIGGVTVLGIEATDTGADTVTLTGHGLSNGDLVVLSGSGTPPAPLVPSVRYYVVNTSGDTFKFAHTVNGTAIDLTSSHVEPVYLRRVSASTTPAPVMRYYVSGDVLTYTYTANPLEWGEGHPPVIVFDSVASDHYNIIMSIASGFAPGVVWRWVKHATPDIYDVRFKIEGSNDVIASFPGAAANAWIELLSTPTGSWTPIAWGGGTTVAGD